MAEATKTSMVYVYDKEGNAYICDIDDLRDARGCIPMPQRDIIDLDGAGFTRNE